MKKELEEYFQACVNACDFSGAVLVAYQGNVIFSRAAGYANLEHEVRNTTKTKFRLASITKPFTAVAVLQLQEKGKLKVSDPVAKHLKWAPKHWKKVTIHHLLTHTSGIPSYTELPTYVGAQHCTNDQIVQQFVDQPLEFEPGEKFNYSNSNYVLLGVLISTKSGRTYKAFLKDNIFDPLRMKNSGVDENQMILPHRAQGYVRDFEGLLVNAPLTDVSNAYAAGDLYSTVEDLHLFDKALSSGKLLSSKTMKAMYTPEKEGYAYGWEVADCEERIAYEHSGGITGFTSLFERIPSDGFCIALLSNIEYAPVHFVGRGLRSIVFGSAFETPKKHAMIKADTSSFKEYVGQYELTPNFVITVRKEGDHLMAQATGQDKLGLKPYAKDKFFLTQLYADITFAREKSGKVTHLILHQNGEDREAKKLKKARVKSK